jgi:hypothetical protein
MEIGCVGAHIFRFANVPLLKTIMTVVTLMMSTAIIGYAEKLKEYGRNPADRLTGVLTCTSAGLQVAGRVFGDAAFFYARHALQIEPGDIQYFSIKRSMLTPADVAADAVFSRGGASPRRKPWAKPAGIRST